MSADSKASAAAAALKRWTDPISDAVGSALLPELISLSAEYAVVRLRFSAQLKSKRMRIADVDGDPASQTLHCDDVPGEQYSDHGWYAALSETALGELSGAGDRVLWTVQSSDDLMTCGVAYGDMPVVQRGWGVDSRGYGLAMRWDLAGSLQWCLAHEAKQVGPLTTTDHPKRCATHPPVTVTADLASNTLHFRVERDGPAPGGKMTTSTGPPRYEWTVAVPDLATAHAFVAIGIGRSAKLTHGDGSASH